MARSLGLRLGISTDDNSSTTSAMSIIIGSHTSQVDGNAIVPVYCSTTAHPTNLSVSMAYSYQ